MDNKYHGYNNNYIFIFYLFNYRFIISQVRLIRRRVIINLVDKINQCNNVYCRFVCEWVCKYNNVCNM
jgi:hypothetical protein